MKRNIFGLVFLILITMAFAAVPEVTQVNYTPSPAVPGTIITVLVQIENAENTAQTNVTIKVGEDYPFTVKEESEKNVGTIEKNGKALAQFVVYIDPSAENETYNLPITVTTKEQPTGKTSYHSVVISGKEPSLKVVKVSEEKLLPGQEKEIILTIQNIGTSTAYDIVTELEEDRTVVTTGTVVEREIMPLGASAVYMDKLAPGEQKETTLKISVNRNATLKNYTLPVKITYRNASGARTTDTPYIGIKISGTVNIGATVKEISQVSGLGEMTIEIFNSGEGKAEYITATIDGEGYIDKPKQFIGSLEPNDVDSIKIKLEKPYQTIKLTITYQDSDAVTKTKTFELTAIQAPIAQGDGNILGLLIPLIALAVIIWFGYNKFVKKK